MPASASRTAQRPRSRAKFWKGAATDDPEKPEQPKKPKKPKPPKPPKTYDWTMNSEGKVHCFLSSRDKCFTTDLFEAARSDFHDGELQKATKEINGILDKVKRSNRDPSPTPGIHPGSKPHDARLGGTGLVGSAADGEDLAEALKITSS